MSWIPEWILDRLPSFLRGDAAARKGGGPERPAFPAAPPSMKDVARQWRSYWITEIEAGTNHEVRAKPPSGRAGGPSRVSQAPVPSRSQDVTSLPDREADSSQPREPAARSPETHERNREGATGVTEREPSRRNVNDEERESRAALSQALREEQEREGEKERKWRKSIDDAGCATLLDRLDSHSPAESVQLARGCLGRFARRVSGATNVLQDWPRKDRDSGEEVRQFESLPFELIRVVSWDFYELIRDLRMECHMRLEREEVRDVAKHVALKLATAAGLQPDEIQIVGEEEAFDEATCVPRDRNQGFPPGQAKVNPRTFMVGSLQPRLQLKAIVDPLPGEGSG
jgi:hypothetical protein